MWLCSELTNHIAIYMLNEEVILWTEAVFVRLSFCRFFLDSSECWSCGGQRAYKVCMPSHFLKEQMRRGVQKNFQNIRCTMETHESYHQQVVKMGHHNDITKNWRFLQNWQKLIREDVKRPALKELHEHWVMLVSLCMWICFVSYIWALE